MPCGRYSSTWDGTGKCIAWGVLESKEEAARTVTMEAGMLAWNACHGSALQKEEVTISPLPYGEACPPACFEVYFRMSISQSLLHGPNRQSNSVAYTTFQPLYTFYLILLEVFARVTCRYRLAPLFASQEILRVSGPCAEMHELESMATLQPQDSNVIVLSFFDNG